MGSPVGTQVLTANHLQHELLSPCVHRPGSCSNVGFWCSHSSSARLWGSFLCCFLFILFWACYAYSILNVLKDTERLYMLPFNCHHCRKRIWNAGIVWEARKIMLIPMQLHIVVLMEESPFANGKEGWYSLLSVFPPLFLLCDDRKKRKRNGYSFLFKRIMCFWVQRKRNCISSLGIISIFQIKPWNHFWRYIITK